MKYLEDIEKPSRIYTSESLWSAKSIQEKFDYGNFSLVEHCGAVLEECVTRSIDSFLNANFKVYVHLDRVLSSKIISYSEKRRELFRNILGWNLRRRVIVNEVDLLFYRV